MVPFYLLQVESDQYPVYVDNSNIDEQLTKDFKINSSTALLNGGEDYELLMAIITITTGWDWVQMFIPLTPQLTLHQAQWGKTM